VKASADVKEYDVTPDRLLRRVTRRKNRVLLCVVSNVAIC